MSPTETLVRRFQEIAAVVPDAVQPLIIALAGTVPFVEGELSAVVGVFSGMHPVAAGVAGAIGNLLSVALVVTVGTRLRAAVLDRRGPRARGPQKLSAGRARLRRFLDRFGVVGASLLGPLALPTQFTGATLVAAGVPRRRVLLWQAVAIVVWTALSTAMATGALLVAL